VGLLEKPLEIVGERFPYWPETFLAPSEWWQEHKGINYHCTARVSAAGLKDCSPCRYAVIARQSTFYVRFYDSICLLWFDFLLFDIHIVLSTYGEICCTYCVICIVCVLTIQTQL